MSTIRDVSPSSESRVEEAERFAGAAAAVERGEWRRALDLLDELGASARTAPGLELRAEAAYGAGHFEAAVTAWEDLHWLFLGQGDRAEAARAAAMAAMYLMMDTGLMAPVRGWLRRAERLVEGHDDAPAHALIAMTATYERFMCGDMEAAGAGAARAIQLGETLGVAPAAIIGRVASARLEIYAGRVDEGLEHLGEVGALLMSGGVDPLTTGMMYCELICAAQGLGRYDLAREWTDVMERWRHGAAFGGIHGRCRVHRAEMLRISGPCDAAEAEALGACDELRPWMRREFGWPLVELGTIRLRRGDLAGAEEAFIAAHRHAWPPHPGLALVRLAQGDVEAARALIQDAIDHPFDVPSKERPPFSDLRLAPLLDAQAEIATAADDADTARRAAAQLRSIAATWPSRGLDAAAELAAARVALLDRELERAIGHAARAVVGWTEMGAPFETAAARLVLGEAHHRLDHESQARMEWEAARAALQAFGAAWWAERVERQLIDRPAPSAVPTTTAPQTATFCREGDTRTVCFGGEVVRVRDLKGMRYLARLLADPGREFHVLDLVAAEEGVMPGRPSRDRAGLDGTAGRGLSVIDQQARAAYRRRLAEVDEDIEEARLNNDVGRLALAERDRAFLVAELTQAVGLAGRHRSIGSDAERARTAVARSIRYALHRLTGPHPTLTAHLDHAVNTGTYCSYTPDPLAPVVWQVSADG